MNLTKGDKPLTEFAERLTERAEVGRAFAPLGKGLDATSAFATFAASHAMGQSLDVSLVSAGAPLLGGILGGAGGGLAGLIGGGGVASAATGTVGAGVGGFLGSQVGEDFAQHYANLRGQGCR